MLPKHAYTLIGAHELKQGGRIVERLVHIRNPHGREKYRGPWSDSDRRWTSEFKRQVNYKRGNDGSYFMTFRDF